MADAPPLFPYQAEGVAAIKRQPKALLFDDPGLGKSCQLLTAARELHATPLLIICPASLQLNWLAEVRLWWPEAAAETSVVLSGRKADYDAKVVIVSYGLAWRRLSDLKAVRWRMVAADEFHLVKDPWSKAGKAVTALMWRSPGRVAITGTAIESCVMDVYPSLRAVGVIDPKMSRHDFGVRYADGKKDIIWTTGRHGREQRTVWVYPGLTNVEELRGLMRPYLIRRRLPEVMHQLPEMVRTTLPVEPHVPVRGEADVSRAVREALDANGRDVGRAVAWFQARHRGDKEKQPVFQLYRETGESKAPSVAKYLADVVCERFPVLVFAHHLKVLSALHDHLRDAGKLVAAIHGGTSVAERQRLVDAFQGGALDCLVLSLTAASTGLTLTRAREIVFAELPWNPLVARQAEGRAFRIGQKNNLVVRYALAPETFDDTLWAMLDRKAVTAGIVLDADPDAHRLHVKAAEGPVASVLRMLFEDEMQRMVAEVRPAGRWTPRVADGRTKIVAV